MNCLPTRCINALITLYLLLFWISRTLLFKFGFKINVLKFFFSCCLARTRYNIKCSIERNDEKKRISKKYLTLTIDCNRIIVQINEEINFWNYLDSGKLKYTTRSIGSIISRYTVLIQPNWGAMNIMSSYIFIGCTFLCITCSRSSHWWFLIQPFIEGWVT